MPSFIFLSLILYFFLFSSIGNRQTVGKEAEDHTEGKVTAALCQR